MPGGGADPGPGSPLADLDLVAVPAVLRVRRGVRRGDTGRMETGLPETAASVRTVRLPGPLAEALAAHPAAIVPDHPGEPVFATSRGTVPARSNLSTTFRRALAAAGVPRPTRQVMSVYR